MAEQLYNLQDALKLVSDAKAEGLQPVAEANDYLVLTDGTLVWKSGDEFQPTVEVLRGQFRLINPLETGNPTVTREEIFQCVKWSRENSNGAVYPVACKTNAHFRKLMNKPHGELIFRWPEEVKP